MDGDGWLGWGGLLLALLYVFMIAVVIDRLRGVRTGYRKRGRLLRLVFRWLRSAGRGLVDGLWLLGAGMGAIGGGLGDIGRGMAQITPPPVPAPRPRPAARRAAPRRPTPASGAGKKPWEGPTGNPALAELFELAFNSPDPAVRETAWRAITALLTAVDN